MFTPTLNERKYVAAERFIRTWKSNIYKYMIPILKNKLADTGNKFFSLYAIIDTNIQFWTAIYQTATYNIKAIKESSILYPFTFNLLLTLINTLHPELDKRIWEKNTPVFSTLFCRSSLLFNSLKIFRGSHWDSWFKNDVFTNLVFLLKSHKVEFNVTRTR